MRQPTAVQGLRGRKARCPALRICEIAGLQIEEIRLGGGFWCVGIRWIDSGRGSDWCWLRQRVVAFLFPELAELVDGVGAEAGVVIVGVGVDGDAAVADFETEIDPAHKLRRAVDDGLVPFDGNAFDPFAVAEPADVGPVGGDGIEFSLEFMGERHSGEVLENEGDFVAAECVGKSCVEPLFISDFNGEFLVGG